MSHKTNIHTAKTDCTGIVKWWNRANGYGFICQCPAYPGLDIIVHYSDILDDGGEGRHKDLCQDQPVVFDAEPNTENGRYKGMKATRVRVRRSV